MYIQKAPKFVNAQLVPNCDKPRQTICPKGAARRSGASRSVSPHPTLMGLDWWNGWPGLVESKLILPAHLKHVRLRGDKLGFFGRFQKAVARSLERFVDDRYQPSLEFAVRHRVAVIAVFIAMGLAMAGYVMGGRMGFSSFPSVENLKVTASLNLPNDLPKMAGALEDAHPAAEGGAGHHTEATPPAQDA